MIIRWSLIVLIAFVTAAALTTYTTRKIVKRPSSTYWCTNTGSLDTDGPCRWFKAERAV